MTTATRSKTYIAAAGETWDVVAFKAYLDERMASVLIQANPRLAHMVVFEGGERLSVPVVDKVKTPESLPPWRR